MSVRSNYLAALTVYWVAVLAYVFVPAFKTVLLFWYFPGWIVVCLVGLGISYGFRCPSCDLPITLRRTPFNGLTLMGTLSGPCGGVPAAKNPWMTEPPLAHRR